MHRGGRIGFDWDIQKIKTNNLKETRRVPHPNLELPFHCIHPTAPSRARFAGIISGSFDPAGEHDGMDDAAPGVRQDALHLQDESDWVLVSRLIACACRRHLIRGPRRVCSTRHQLGHRSRIPLDRQVLFPACAFETAARCCWFPSRRIPRRDIAPNCFAS